MTSTSPASDIDVASIWKGVRRSLPVVLVCALVAAGLTYGTLALMAPRYEAETQLTITAKTTNPYPTSKNDAGAAATVTPRLDPAAINTHVRALMAPDLLLEVGRKLDLGQRPEFNSAIGPVDTFDRLGRMLGIGGPRPGETVESRVLANMRKRLTVASVRESRFIMVRFTSTDPQIAADVANGIATAYRRSLREIPVRETNDAVAALLPKIKQLTREVFEAEARAKRFRAESDQLTGGSTALTLQQQRLTQLSADLVKSEAELARSEARLSAARELERGGSADTLPEVQQSRIMQDLIAQRIRVERQVNEARAVLLPAHPRMRQLNADLAGLRATIRTEIATIVNSISKEVRLAQLRTGRLRNQIADLKKVAVANSEDEARLRSLETTALSKRNELERLQRQLEDNRTIVDTNRVPVESTIVSTARASDVPVFPKKASTSVLVMVATLMLGIALVVARELLLSRGPARHDRRRSDKARAAARGNVKPAAKRSDAAARASDAPATAPVGRKSASARTAPHSSAGETSESDPPNPSIAELARMFAAAAPAESGHRLLLAGADRDVDPSDEAIELAAELSDRGARVLMIDWALDGHPLLADIDVGAARSFADLLANRAQFEDVLVALPDSNVHYTYSSRVADTDALLNPDALNLILDALDEAYDQVLVFGRYDDARQLFEVIEGRFDAGMTVADAGRGPARPPPGHFLGFDVTDIELVGYVRPKGAGGRAPMSGRRAAKSASQRA